MRVAKNKKNKRKAATAASFSSSPKSSEHKKLSRNSVQSGSVKKQEKESSSLEDHLKLVNTSQKVSGKKSVQIERILSVSCHCHSKFKSPALPRSVLKRCTRDKKESMLSLQRCYTTSSIYLQQQQQQLNLVKSAVVVGGNHFSVHNKQRHTQTLF